MKNSPLFVLMVAQSNNSRLTQSVCESLLEKLSDAERRDFMRWLRLVEQNRENAIQRSRRYPFR